MKKLAMILLVATTILASACGTTNNNKVDGYYLASGVVVETDRAADIFTVETKDGNLWEMTEIEDWAEGDTCVLTIYDNGTEKIDDDIIINAKYTGWIY